MIDRNDLDLRVNAHRNQIQSINQTQWQSVDPIRPASTLRQQVANMLISLASRLDSRSAVHTDRVSPKPVGSLVA